MRKLRNERPLFPSENRIFRRINICWSLIISKPIKYYVYNYIWPRQAEDGQTNTNGSPCPNTRKLFCVTPAQRGLGKYYLFLFFLVLFYMEHGHHEYSKYSILDPTGTFPIPDHDTGQWAVELSTNLREVSQCRKRSLLATRAFSLWKDLKQRMANQTARQLWSVWGLHWAL